VLRTRQLRVATEIRREDRARREKGGFAFSGTPNRGFVRISRAPRDATLLTGQEINSRWNYRAIPSSREERNRRVTRCTEDSRIAALTVMIEVHAKPNDPLSPSRVFSSTNREGKSRENLGEIKVATRLQCCSINAATSEREKEKRQRERERERERQTERETDRETERETEMAKLSFASDKRNADISCMY